MNRQLLLVLSFMVFAAVFVSGCFGLPSRSDSTTDMEVEELIRKGRSIQGLSFDMVQTMYHCYPQNLKVMMQGQKIRTELITDKQQTSIELYFSESKIVYHYTAGQKSALKRRQETIQWYGVEAFFLTIDLAHRCKVVETVTYEGVPCKVIQLKNPKPGQDYKVWIRSDYGVPIKIEITADGQMNKIEYKNMKVGPQPESLFLIPDGVKVMEMP